MKPEWQHFHHIFCSLLARYTWKKFLLAIFSPFAMFVKTLTADDKYSLPNSENLQKTIKMQLSKILKTFSRSFAELVQSTSNFKHFEKKRCPSFRMYFRNYPLWKAPLHKCLNGTVSSHTSTVNMFNDAKHLRNLHESTFTKFLCHSEQNWLGKLLSYWYRVFIKILTADHKYSLCYIWNVQVLY